MASQFNASILTARNENTLALANVTLDFSLFKVQPPVEFGGLGNSLSEQRRSTAEDGPPHQTARKLGALFEQIIPATPNLIKAYGFRASEISRSSAANPPGGGQDGIFLQHVGPDGTSLWAAATSGASAISAHLLACMLARTWPGPEAIAIWVEIVAERTRMIMSKAQEDAYNTPMGALFAARAGITRKELADWDASARAWLQVADDAKQLQQKQLLLIVRNISLPVNEMPGTFSSVIEAWTTAMVAVEKLINGQPQSASKGAILLGLASWSLYPDLLVLAETPTPVRFGDELFLTGGTLTIGLENNDSNSDEGVYWSLALSHLRYYGDPVVSKTSVANQASRIQIEELHLLCLGSVLAGWGEAGSDVVSAAEFFVVLWERIQQATIDPENPHHFAASESGWLYMLVSASRKLLTLKGEERENAFSIVTFGRRKAYRFLAEPTNHPPPMFGLAAPFVMNSLSHAHDATNFGLTDDVIMMRTIAEQLQLSPGDCIIRSKQNSSHNRELYEYTTGVPHRSCSEPGIITHRWWIESSYSRAGVGGCDCHRKGKACVEGKCRCMVAGAFCSRQCHGKGHEKGCGELCTRSCQSDGSKQLKFKCENENLGCRCHGEQPACFPGHCSCIERGVICTSRCHDSLTQNGCGTNCGSACPAKSITPPKTEYRCSNARPGEESRLVKAGFFRDFTQKMETMTFQVGRQVSYDTVQYIRPAEYHDLSKSKTLRDIQFKNTDVQTLCECYTSHPALAKPIFGVISGDLESAALCLRVDGTAEQVRMRQYRMMEAMARAKSKPLANIKVTTHMLRSQISPVKLLEFMSKLSTMSPLVLPGYGETVELLEFEFQDYMRSLEALSLATKSYRELTRATISIDIISRPLHKSRWIPSGRKLLADPAKRILTRQNLFCCIAMLDSGFYNLNPSDLEDVMAISVRNTIYVSKSLLCDPYHASNENKIALVVGNVGQTGMVLMIAPQAPRVRKSDLNHWRQISHSPFDGKSEDSFKSTSLHLSFTEFVLPLSVSKERRGAIDSDLKLVETLISAHDRGKWVGDLDVLAIYKENSHLLHRFEPHPECTHDRSSDYPHKLTSLDNWEEILNAPEDFGHENVGIVRSSSNWLGRIATACISLQLGYKTVILPSEMSCWHCCCRSDWKWDRQATRKGVLGSNNDGEATPNKASVFSKLMRRRGVGIISEEDEDEEEGLDDTDDLFDSGDEMPHSFDFESLKMALETDKGTRPQIFIC